MPPLPQAPQPLSQDGIEEIVAWQEAMARELALSRAKTLCLKAERFFEAAIACGVSELYFETLHHIEVRLVNLAGAHKPAIPVGSAEISRRLDSRWVEKAFSQLLRDFNTVGDELKSAGVTNGFGASCVSEQIIDPATAAALLFPLLLGAPLHAQWMSEREAHAIAMAVGEASQSRGTQPRL